MLQHLLRLARLVGVAAAAGLLLPLASCGGTGGGARPGPACNALGTSEAELKVAAFFQAGDAFEADAAALAADLETTCGQIAADLGVEVPTAAEDELQVEATCRAVSAEIESILSTSVEAGGSLAILFEPPVCTISVDAYAECTAECDIDVDAEVDVMCTEGRLVGTCSGTCTGECRVEGEVACEARCEGTCTGSCEGTCVGACEGTCESMDAEGNCQGACDGTCMGSCTASCTGTCEGSCTSDVEASCEGECAGSCDVDFEAPRCEGDAQVTASAECEAACDAQINADAECTEPSVSIYIDGEIAADGEARLALLVASLSTHYPRLLGLNAKLQRVVASGAALVRAFNGAASAANQIGLRVTACFVDSTLRATDALATVEVSFEVSVEVSVAANATVE